MLNSLLKSAVLMICLSRVAVAEPDSTANLSIERQIQLEATLQMQAETMQLQQAHDGRFARATSTYYNNTDKFKIESLYGKWQVTYKLGSVQTDLIEIDSTIQDKDFGFYGWDNKHGISCFYEPSLLGTSYSYQCLHITDSTKGIAQRYIFNINGNNLSGKYFIGTVEDFINALRANQLVDLTGYNPNFTAETYFNEVTNELIIPKATVLGKKYNAILKYDGKDGLSIKSINPL